MFRLEREFLTQDNNVKVLDFGIARAVKKPEQGESTTVFDPARLGAFTPAYASLEIIEGTSPDPRDHVRQLALPDSTALLETHKVLREGHQMQLNQVKKAEVQRLAEISKRKAQVEKMLNLSPLTAKRKKTLNQGLAQLEKVLPANDPWQTQTYAALHAIEKKQDRKSTQAPKWEISPAGAEKTD